MKNRVAYKKMCTSRPFSTIKEVFWNLKNVLAQHPCVSPYKTYLHWHTFTVLAGKIPCFRKVGWQVWWSRWSSGIGPIFFRYLLSSGINRGIKWNISSLRQPNYWIGLIGQISWLFGWTQSILIRWGRPAVVGWNIRNKKRKWNRFSYLFS